MDCSSGFLLLTYPAIGFKCTGTFIFESLFSNNTFNFDSKKDVNTVSICDKGLRVLFSFFFLQYLLVEQGKP